MVGAVEHTAEQVSSGVGRLARQAHVGAAVPGEGGAAAEPGQNNVRCRISVTSALAGKNSDIVRVLSIDDFDDTFSVFHQIGRNFTHFFLT